MSKEEPPSEEGLRNARERFGRARRILDAAKQQEITFDPFVEWTPESDEESEDEKNA